ncbi:hypothetical protein F0L74_28935 [Chitinophaga agrisoli]|uniref:Natural product n=1 Tax=Chitinophaga agrisoli TaxID=2607653 RepID=A0A5B2VN55_9BACT|nr:class I lanthipeptide [Chitinophaga agrisoli]KAA2240194.1 hypothetical protein F0L74_28935 [Chitinophaga agrisoli]
MKPNKDQNLKSKLSLNRQTIAKLDEANMNLVRGGQANQVTSLPCTIIILSIGVSCSNCGEEAI